VTARERIQIVLGLAVVALLVVYVVSHFRVTTDIQHFMPTAEDRELAAVSRQITDSELSRTLILAIEGPDTETAIRAGRALETALRRDERTADPIAFLEGGPPAGVDRDLFELYDSRTLYFLAPTAEAARERLGEDGLRRALRRLRSELGGPLSSLVSRVAGRDPLLAIPKLFDRFEQARAGSLGLADGRFVASDGRTAILFLGTQASALDTRVQARFLEAVEAVWAEVSADFAVGVRLDQSGVHRFAVRTAEAIEGDIQRVSLVSSALIGCLLLWLFRSLRLLLLASIPVAAGVLAGSASVLFVFGQLHGITLAFGASLIGVSIDYVVHLYCHRSIVQPEGGARSSIRTIRLPLATGAITTIAGFAALAASRLVGLREVALFSVSGILMAFVVTVVFLPSLLPDRVVEVAARRRWIDGLESVMAGLRRRGRRLVWVPIAAIGFIAVMLPHARWNPDIASLAQMDPELMAEDERVRAKVAPFEQMRFVVALGEQDATALEVNDAVAESLAEAVSRGELGSQRSLAWLLPSPARQRAVAAVALEDDSLASRLRRIAEEEGFSATAFDPFLASLSDPFPPPLAYSDLIDSPLAGLVRSFRVTLGERVGFVTFVEGVRDIAAIEARIEAIPGAVFLQQAALFEEAQLRYQTRTLELLGWGLLAVLVLLGIRYREPTRVGVAFLPSLVAAGTTVSVLTLLGRGLDLISLTALLFVVSMGVDYSVFLVDAQDEADPKSVSAALLGALLAGFSTLVAFGLLALSDHPVLAGLGWTAAVGIATSVPLAPIALAWLRPEPRSGGPRGESTGDATADATGGVG